MQSNIQDVYALYYAQSAEYGEIAASNHEKEILNSLIKRLLTQNIKNSAKRTETLFQGVLNNETLLLDQKKKYLKQLVNLFTEVAKQKGYSNNKIQDFTTKANKQIELVTSSDLDFVQNALKLEQYLSELFGWQ